MPFTSVQLRHLPFLPVATPDGISCGGHQLWYPLKDHAVRGCAPVAAANLTAYLGMYHSGCGPLYPYPSLGQSDFLAHMHQLYDFVRPGPLGAYDPAAVARRIQSYGASKQVALAFQQISAQEPLLVVLQFIHDALRADLPVAALVLHLPIFSNAALGWHWVTITGLLERQGVPVLQLSNHAREEFVPLEDFYRLQHQWPSFGGSYLAAMPGDSWNVPA